jgi:hypothetical protein
MTTLDTLGSANPDPREVSRAALAMADFDAKDGDFPMALDWLEVAEQQRKLSPEYAEKKIAWGKAVRERKRPRTPARRVGVATR